MNIYAYHFSCFLLARRKMLKDTHWACKIAFLGGWESLVSVFSWNGFIVLIFEMIIVTDLGKWYLILLVPESLLYVLLSSSWVIFFRLSWQFSFSISISFKAYLRFSASFSLRLLGPLRCIVIFLSLLIGVHSSLMFRSLKSQQLCDWKRLSGLYPWASTVEEVMLSVSFSHPWEASRGGFCDSCSLVPSLSLSRGDATQLFSFLSVFPGPGKPSILPWAISTVSWEFIESRRPNLRQQPGSHPCTLALLYWAPGL